MSELDNQHYVPQFYFRRFSDGRKLVNLLLVNTGKIIPVASIKTQCSSHRFYGSKEVERELGKLDAKHSAVLKSIASNNFGDSAKNKTSGIVYDLCEFVLLQRSRTLLEFEKYRLLRYRLLAPAFRDYIETTSDVRYREEILNVIDNGGVEISEPRVPLLLSLMQDAIDDAMLITDLGICLLQNETDYPFIFSDSPVVFYNALMRRISHRGVLGLQSPGLQIFLPLGPNLCLMLYDKNAYPFHDFGRIMLTSNHDVSQINTLQIHHCNRIIYFGEINDQQYVWDFWNAHRKSVRRPAVETSIRRNWLVDGKVEPNPVAMVFEPHLNLHLNLSFLQCAPIAEQDFKFRYRNPALVAEHEKIVSGPGTVG